MTPSAVRINTGNIYGDRLGHWLYVFDLSIKNIKQIAARIHCSLRVAQSD